MKYQLVVKFPFETIDDIEARKRAERMLADIHRQYNDPIDSKLQEVYENKPPRGININSIQQ
jgi:hypothetical protein